MKKFKYKRITIFGLPGSGKSTFSNQLSKTTGLPVHHLDKHYFQANWKERERAEFLAIQQSFVNSEKWIIEGNSIKTLEMRFARADLVIYFHFPRYLCLWRVLKRYFFPDHTIPDLAEGCTKSIRWPLIEYLWNFEQEKREHIEELRKKYPHVDFLTFQNQKDIKQFLNT